MLKKIIVGLVLTANVALGCQNQLVHNLGESLISEHIVVVEGDTLYINEERMESLSLEASLRDGRSKKEMDQIIATSLHIFLTNHYPKVNKYVSE